jgi:hypothetical protein
MKTREEIKKEYPLLNETQLQKIIDFNDFHGFLDDDKMRQALAFKVLKKMYLYEEKPINLKTLCEILATQKISIKENDVILQDGSYYNMQVTAITYIKYLQFENSIKNYYIEKQKDRSELIYCDLNKIISEVTK